MISILSLIIVAVNLVGVSADVGCWKQNPPPGRQHFSTVYKHCYEGIKDLAKLDKAYAPILFSRKPDAGYRVPERWITGTCFIHIDMHSDDDEDYVSFHHIAIEAGVINAACVARPPHLGGTSPVGPKRVMNVTIMGFRPLRGNVLALNGEYPNFPGTFGGAWTTRREIGPGSALDGDNGRLADWSQS
ncbi:MAG: hypothetical protein Q9221_002209 [Calogaya cf. arnoldii]